MGPELVVVVLVMAEETRKQRLINRHSGFTKEVKHRLVNSSNVKNIGIFHL